MRSQARRIGVVSALLLAVVGGVAAYAVLRERNHSPWACPADRLGTITVDSAGTGGAATALDAVRGSIPNLAEDTGVPGATLREAATGFEPRTGRNATYPFLVDDGVVAEVDVARLRDETWGVQRIELCFREP